MKTILFALALLLGSTSLTTAQDFFLPVSSKSKTAKPAYYKAAEYASNIHFKEAGALLDLALEEDPNFFMAYVLRIFYSSEEKRANLIDQALAINTKKLNIAERILRRQLVKWDEDPKAKTAQAMKALIAAYPKSPQAYEWASLHAAFGDNEKDVALDYTRKLAELSPDYAPNYNTMGYLYMQMQQMNEAKVAFDKYLASAPKEPNAYDSMAEYYMNAKDYTKSAEYYDKAANMGITDAKARADKAREMMKQK